jgi:hypothetical protein
VTGPNLDLIRTDNRGRVSTGREPGKLFNKIDLPDGSILLSPVAAVMTEAEAAMWQRRPEVAAMLASDDSDVNYVEVDLETGLPVTEQE